jgi:hypothetical protein
VEEAPDFDLQSHSTCSDGELEPAAVVAAAAAAGVRLLALSDHDTLEGLAAAQAAAADAGIALVPAVEISTREGADRDLHVLGYRIDLTNARLIEVMHLARADRATRAERIAQTLRELGFKLDDDWLASRRATDGAIGRPHLAAAVTAHPDNAARLRAEGLDDPSAFFGAYLTPGRPAFHDRAAPSVAGAVELIHGAGGVAVWAHPFWDIDSTADVLASLDRFAAVGLDGVEAFYPTHSAEQAGALHRRASERGLLITGSGDFHGPNHARFNRFRGFSLHGLEPRLGPIDPNVGRD